MTKKVTKKVGSPKSAVGSKKAAKKSVANKKTAPVAKKPTIKKTAANKTAKRVSRRKPVYQKVGRLDKVVADAIGYESADICVSNSGLRHIFEGHHVELAQLGLTPVAFVSIVATNFNRIYKGHGQALILALCNGNAKVVIIELSLRQSFYYVKTAFVKNQKSLDKIELLWSKK